MGFNNIVKTLPIYKQKFIFFKEALERFGIKGYKEDEFLKYFNKIQRVYHTLNRFVFNYKFKKAPIVVNADMTLNELKENLKSMNLSFGMKMQNWPPKNIEDLVKHKNKEF